MALGLLTAVTERSTTTSEWLATWAGVVTAGAAVVGLWLSIRTARAAQQEATAARTALGLVGKPTVHAHITTWMGGSAEAETRAVVWVTEQPAADVEVNIELRDGTRAQGRTERLEANTHGKLASVRGDSLSVPCGPPRQQDIETSGGIDRVTVRYRDQRRMLRWEWTQTVTTTVRRTDTSVGSSTATAVEERLLDR